MVDGCSQLDDELQFSRIEEAYLKWYPVSPAFGCGFDIKGIHFSSLVLVMM
jgi:hypothetical protein